MMPTLQDYDLAVDNLAISALDPELAAGYPQRDGNRLVAYTGGVSRVYPVEVGSRTVALRCWHKRADRQAERYRHLAELFRDVRLPYFADVRYIENGLRIGTASFPVVWMEWIPAPSLNTFLDQHATNPSALLTVAERFARLSADLHQHGIAHGDLQDGNILVSDQGDGPTLRLIDYDTLYAPSLGAWANDATVTRDFQHPRRGCMQFLTSGDDHFSALVIYLSLLAIAENPGLWKVGNESRLLFAERDFAEPDASETFSRLSQMSREVRRLNEQLREFCRLDPGCLPPLGDVLSGARRLLLVEAYFRAIPREEPLCESQQVGGGGDAEREDARGGANSLETYFSRQPRAHEDTEEQGALSGWFWAVVAVVLLFAGLLVVRAVWL